MSIYARGGWLVSQAGGAEWETCKLLQRCDLCMHWLVNSEGHLVMTATDEAPTMCQALCWAFCVHYLIAAFCCSGQQSWSLLNCTLSYPSSSLSESLVVLPSKYTWDRPTFNPLQYCFSPTFSLPQFISQHRSQSLPMKTQIMPCHYAMQNPLWLPISE